MNIYKLVKEFNIQVLEIEPTEIERFDTAVYDHLSKCLEEELCELDAAHQFGNIADQVDALIDLIYFALGGIHKLGLSDEQFHQIFYHVHEKNMQKKKGIIDKRATENVADAIKPPNWTSPEDQIKEILQL